MPFRLRIKKTDGKLDENSPDIKNGRKTAVSRKWRNEVSGSFRKQGISPGVALAVGLVLAWGGSAGGQSAPPGLGPGSGPGLASAYRGLVVAEKQVELKAPVEGILRELLVEESQRVQAGSRLAAMDDDVQEATVRAAMVRAENTTEVTIRQLALKESIIRLERMQDLYRNGAAQEWELRQAQLQRDMAEAELEAARLQLKLAVESLNVERRRLDKLRVNAPFDGRVVRLNTVAGATLRQEDSILLFVDLSRLKAEFHLPAELFNLFQVGKFYDLEAEEPVNRRLRARLRSVEPVIDPASRTFRCVLEIENAEESLPAGFSVRLIGPSRGD